MHHKVSQYVNNTSHSGLQNSLIFEMFQPAENKNYIPKLQQVVFNSLCPGI